VEYTTIPGDLRVGIDLLKRSALNAERRSSRKINIEDIDRAYTTSRLVHLTYILKSFRVEEKILLDLISNYTEITSGELYKIFHKKSGLGYTRFYETLEKLSALKLIDTNFTGKGTRGRSRIITLRYSANEIKKRLRNI
jgi:cell division control protein 6